VRYATDVTLD